MANLGRIFDMARKTKIKVWKKKLQQVYRGRINTLLRILNSLLLVGILAVLVLIFLRVREPISVQEPVSIQGWRSLPAWPIKVEIDNTPIEVEISR
jgi:hypothetical protein